jgi:hypothetical protein
MILYFSTSQEHLDTSHKNPLCEQCGEEFNSVDSLIQHNSVCERVPIDCALKQYGCNEQVFIEFYSEYFHHIANYF